MIKRRISCCGGSLLAEKESSHKEQSIGSIGSLNAEKPSVSRRRSTIS